MTYGAGLVGALALAAACTRQPVPRSGVPVPAPDPAASPAVTAAPAAPTLRTAARSYFTSPDELAAIRDKAARGIEPYRAAVAHLLGFAGPPDAWPFGAIDGPVHCVAPGGLKNLFRKKKKSNVPVQIADRTGGPLVLAKAYAYHLTSDVRYAESARAHILDLVDTTEWGGEKYSGGNQCILNLSWFVPRFIQAAALLDGAAVWTTADKLAFQDWLAREVYRKASWNSAHRNNNWGAAGSLTSAMIADYVDGAVAELVDQDGTARSPAEAWLFHGAVQVRRMNGELRMDSHCDVWGIQTHGGIPDELRRGNSGCAATALARDDASYTYQLAHIQSLTAHAEILWRRGERLLFENVAADGGGSLKQSVLFVIANPTRSWAWAPKHISSMEVLHRAYRDPRFCDVVRCKDAQGRATGDSNRVLSFATLTHGFASGENPAPPPVQPPPGGTAGNLTAFLARGAPGVPPPGARGTAPVDDMQGIDDVP